MLLTVLTISSFLLSFRLIGKTRFEEVDVERINVVGTDGKLKMVFSNMEKFPRTDNGGTPQQRRGPGMLFFNDEGEECGGYLFGGGKDGKAYAHFTFDQYKQDQVLVLKNNDRLDEHGEPISTTGMLVSGRPNNVTHQRQRMLEDSILRIPDAASRRQAFKALREQYRGVSNTLFLGRTEDDDYGLFLTDKQDRDRLILYLDKNGNPRLEFLDSLGNILARIPANQ